MGYKLIVKMENKNKIIDFLDRDEFLEENEGLEEIKKHENCIED